MNKSKESIKHKLHTIIQEADTPMGKAFDILLLIAILLSVIIVMLDSVHSINEKFSKLFFVLEWTFTIFFTIEYFLRIYITKNPFKNYIFSFYGIIDFLAILPTYLSMVLTGSHFMMVIRIFRLIRVFRILKLGRYVGASQVLRDSLYNSRHKITVFLEIIMTIVVLMGSIMYIVEGPENGFTSIPRGIYWAIVTLTTVGYGDIAPTTVFGQFLASIIMIMGYAIIAVPTGIVSSEMIKSENKRKINLNTLVCENCHCDKHEDGARFCKICGAALLAPEEENNI
ncbi:MULTISPECIES: ion transporter [unclassified Lentimicrobium]|uniref:ion transporter n=1 Tax=unclassified Lentimicrobium TaxID=2677434 RepID=UPI0015576B52|nr:MULTISPECIES: ion transporter [unclassified Lentimicrobium]NPD45914.1 ion transporter [Lentimicrobium sp. S6]NPD85923.1 ion transporter [Lentimicrobium sp. L6]